MEINNDEEKLCEICGTHATRKWLGTDVSLCDNIVCDVALWEIWVYIVNKGVVPNE